MIFGKRIEPKILLAGLLAFTARAGIAETSFADIQAAFNQNAIYGENAPVTALITANGATTQTTASSDVVATPMQIAFQCGGGSLATITSNNSPVTDSNGTQLPSAPAGSFSVSLSDPTAAGMTTYTLNCVLQGIPAASQTGATDASAATAQSQTPVVLGSAQASVRVIWLYPGAGGPVQASAVFVRKEAAAACLSQIGQGKGCAGAARGGVVSGYEMQQLGIAPNQGNCICGGDGTQPSVKLPWFNG